MKYIWHALLGKRTAVVPNNNWQLDNNNTLRPHKQYVHYMPSIGQLIYWILLRLREVAGKYSPSLKTPFECRQISLKEPIGLFGGGIFHAFQNFFSGPWCWFYPFMLLKGSMSLALWSATDMITQNFSCQYSICRCKHNFIGQNIRDDSTAPIHAYYSALLTVLLDQLVWSNSQSICEDQQEYEVKCRHWHTPAIPCWYVLPNVTASNLTVPWVGPFCYQYAASYDHFPIE